MTGSAAPATGAKPKGGEAPVLERALATAALRVADGLTGLGLGTGARTTRRLDAAEAFEGLDERALILLIDPQGHDPMAPDGPSAEVLATRTGLLAFDPGLTDSLIEVQTIGRVDGPARPPRRPTRIDAALSQPFARALLDQLCRQLGPGAVGPRPGALRAGSYIAGPASLGLILTAAGYLRIDLELRLGDGARAGALSLILPVEDMPAAAPDPASAADPEAEWARTMREAARGAPVRLEAVLPPMRLPLSRLMSLAVGDLIPLDPGALSDVTLHGGSSGLTIRGRRRLPRAASMKARLGQLNGVRAVKVSALPGEVAARGGGDQTRDPGFDGDALVSGPGRDGDDGAPPRMPSEGVGDATPVAGTRAGSDGTDEASREDARGVPAAR